MSTFRAFFVLTTALVAVFLVAGTCFVAGLKALNVLPIGTASWAVISSSFGLALVLGYFSSMFMEWDR